MSLAGLRAVFKRELIGYFATPIAYVFLAIFLFAIGAFTFYFAAFYEREQADLQAFFTWHPWLYLFFIPAISMRLWAEERKSGTFEVLATLPVPIWQLVLGKFLAAWLFTAMALVGTLPIWITVNYLGDPDNGVIVASYLGSLLMAGSYLAIGACISAMTRNQVIAFIVAVIVSFLFTVSGMPLVINLVQGLGSNTLVNLVASFSFLTNFSDMSRGILELDSLFFMLSVMALWLSINTLVLQHRNRV